MLAWPPPRAGTADVDGSVADGAPRELRHPPLDVEGVYRVLIVATPKQDAPGPARRERSSSRPIAIVNDPRPHTVSLKAPDGIVGAERERRSIDDEDAIGLHETEAALRRAIESRDEVLRVVSHDLRDPLQCITLAAQQIGEQIDAGLAPASLRTVVDRLARSSRSMTRLVDDLLDVASIEVGRLGLRPAVLRADAAVREVLDTHQARAQARGVTLTITTQTSASIVADPGRMQQALSNIVGNALKFTPAGGTVAVRAEDDEGAVRLSVADTGPGIGREHVGRVFEPFWQSNHADRRGRGLGLAIAKGIVEAHGGRIWLESELGRGTTVCFTVPKAMTP